MLLPIRLEGYLFEIIRGPEKGVPELVSAAPAANMFVLF
jgi:hypothetical protein